MSIRKNSCLHLDGAPVTTWEQMQSCYAQRRKTHGCTAAAMYYSRDELHRQRLEQVRQLLAMYVQPGETLLDVGCGFGDLAPYLPDCHYTGLDVIEECVQEARRRHPDRQFLQQNLLEMEVSEANRRDWVAMVGIMGTLPLPEEVLMRGLALARKGLVVDFIDARRYQGPLNHYDLGECAGHLLELDAGQVLLYPTPAQPWTFVVALKSLLFTDPSSVAPSLG